MRAALLCAWSAERIFIISEHRSVCGHSGDVYKRQVLGSRASLVTSLVLLVVAIVLELAVLSVIRARTRAKTSGDAA